jgi:hypothetical protein
VYLEVDGRMRVEQRAAMMRPGPTWLALFKKPAASSMKATWAGGKYLQRSHTTLHPILPTIR